jgi:hypothetical protein
MTDAAYIEDARGWAKELVRKEARGPGDQENAMRRLEARYGIPWRTFWTLKYRPPSDVFVSVYNRLQAAYRAECERQMRLLKHELEITKARGLSDTSAYRSAAALVAKAEGVEE